MPSRLLPFLIKVFLIPGISEDILVFVLATTKNWTQKKNGKVEAQKHTEAKREDCENRVGPQDAPLAR